MIKKKFTIQSLDTVIGLEDFSVSSVVIPLIPNKDSFNILFEKRAKNISHADEICFPGGKFDSTKDHTTEQTALREFEEELGIANHHLEIIGYIGKYIAPLGTIIHVYVGELSSESLSLIKLCKSEVESIIQLPINYFQNNSVQNYELDNWSFPYRQVAENKKILFPAETFGLPNRYSNPWKTGSRKVYLYQTDYGAIWGITAAILRHFIQLF